MPQSAFFVLHCVFVEIGGFGQGNMHCVPNHRSHLIETNTRAGMNIARALGDKFLKEEEAAFSAEPHISNVFRLSGDGLGLVVMARYVPHIWGLGY